jgi:hypothetical protein
MAGVWGTIKDHKGYIDVQSTEGKGIIFTLYFPVTRKETARDKPKKNFCNSFNHLIHSFKDLTVGIKGLFSKAHKNYLIRIFICFYEFLGLS